MGDVYLDHYTILGLPTGKEGAKLTVDEIRKAYKTMALLLHPDKNQHDSKATAKFLRLQSSYDILMDDKTRQLFDEQLSRHFELDAKRRRMDSDLARYKEEEEEEEAKAREEARRASTEAIIAKAREDLRAIAEAKARERARLASTEAIIAKAREDLRALRAIAEANAREEARARAEAKARQELRAIAEAKAREEARLATKAREEAIAAAKVREEAIIAKAREELRAIAEAKAAREEARLATKAREEARAALIAAEKAKEAKKAAEAKSHSSFSAYYYPSSEVSLLQDQLLELVHLLFPPRHP
ncbi:hypothetical protein CsatB_008353 [Cannabis sativa]|uniref:J domain-containing protein n=2 Tax=Cannabis sativa TaxID=3483 RepID=A0AB40EAL9_CANSA|nr:hypothetical protein F8388_019457 [Cannabis sativa]KAF4394869.1 hypothetical protein G4B88_002746 [Cannabis sativa]